MEINGKIIFETVFGSQVYGTDTPESDVDYKGIYIPKLEDLVLNKQKDSIVTSTGDQFSKNSSDDVDIEYKSLRAFLNDAMSGQTYALDMLFIPKEHWVQSSEVWEFIIKNRDKLISNNVKPYIGYCRKQAGKYGLKGSRLGELHRVIEELSFMKPKLTLNDYPELDESKYVYYEDLQVKKGADESDRFINVLGKRFQKTIHIEKISESLNKMDAKYGSRARLAMENKGVDWKAISHAYRCCYQLIELAETLNIQFPLKEAEKLKKIKLGNYEYKDIQDELYELMEKATKAVESSNLPNEPDRKFWNEYLLNVYLNQSK